MLKKHFYRVTGLAMAIVMTLVSVELPVRAEQPEAIQQTEIEALINEAPEAEASEAKAPEDAPEQAAPEAPAEDPSVSDNLITPLLSYHLIPGEGEYESVREHRVDSPISADMAVELPRRYNPRDNEEESYLPPTRNQGNYGTCWAHATMAAAEISMTKNKGADKDSIDLSELQLAYFMYYPPETDPLGLVYGDSNRLGNSGKYAGKNFLSMGGNVGLAGKIMQGWITATNDVEELAYSNAGDVLSGVNNGGRPFADSLAYDNPYHLRNYYEVNLKSDPQEVKKLIMDCGLVTASFYADETYKNGASFYNNVKTDTNHAVSIVGWDDDYSKTNFKTTPPGNGAWLVRNSWSTTSSYSYYSYFWMSYYDTSLTGGIAMEFEYEDKYDYNYHYDMAAGDMNYTYASGVQIANVFKAQKERESLRAVSFETGSTNVNYEVKIYKNLEDLSDPESGEMVSAKSGSAIYEGYYTVPLDTYVSLQKNDTFSVVVTQSHADKSSVVIPRENTYDWSWIAGTANSRPGESFVNRGYGWTDVNPSGKENCGNLRIKAFTKDMSSVPVVPATSLSLSRSAAKLKYGAVGTLTATVLPADATNKDVSWSSSDTSIATVSNGKVTATGIGTVTIKAALKENPSITATCEVTVIPNVSLKAGNYAGTNSVAYADRIILGKDFAVNVTVAPAGALDAAEYTWVSSDPKVLTVAGDGASAVVTPAAKGTATVTATAKSDKDIKASLEISVKRLDYPQVQYEQKPALPEVVFTWNAVPGADSYKLYLYEKDKKDTTLQEYPTKELTYTVGNLKAGTTYYCYVVAFNADGTLDSSWYTSQRSFSLKNLYKIDYELNGGDNSDANPSQIEEKKTVILQKPTKAGYQFSGWYQNALFSGTAVSYLTNVTRDVTLYAKWTPIQYFVQYNGNGSTSGLMASTTMTYDVETALPQSTFEKTGYTFAGWNTKQDGSGDTYEDQAAVKNLTDVLNSSVELFAIWKPIDYLINYELNGGENHKDNPASYHVGDPQIVLREPTREKYLFDGWYLDEEMRDQEMTVIDTSKGGDLTLYARWKINEAENWGDVTEEILEARGFRSPDDIPAGMWIYGVESADYCGEAITFDGLQVFFGKTLLQSGTDYSISYERNVNAYTLQKGNSGFDATRAPAVVVSGKGNYSGKYTETFVIYPLDIDEAAEATDVLLKYNGRVQYGVPTVTYLLNGKSVTLKNGRDFSCSYLGTDENSFKAVNREEGYQIRVTGIGNYTGTLAEPVIERITSCTPMSKLVYTVESSKYEPDKYIYPKHLYIRHGKKWLTGRYLNSAKDRETAEKTIETWLQDEETTAKFEFLACCYDNTLYGTATVLIAGVPERGYEGTVAKTYKITGIRKIKNATITGLKSSYPWKAEGVDPFAEGSVSISYSGTTLQKDRDYTLKYSGSRTKSGTVKVTITGINAYSGTVTKKYTIAKYNLQNDPQGRIKTSAYGGNTYVKKGLKPTIVVTDNGKVLEAGKDYTVTYKNNNAVYPWTRGDAKYKASKAPSMTVTGKGNYTGTLMWTFPITATSFNNVTIEAKDVAYQRKANLLAGAVVLRDTNGEKLVAGTDYVKSIVYTYEQDTMVECVGASGKINGSAYRPAGTAVVLKTDVIPVGTQIRATVTGKGKYAQGDKKTAVIHFVAASVEKAVVTMPVQYYTGKAVEPSKDDITVKVGDKILRSNEYEIEGYANNIEKGKATMTIKGTGRYGGRKTVTFEIKSRSIGQ